MQKFLKLTFVFLLLLSPFVVRAQNTTEEITNFHSDIQVEKNGRIIVTENIWVIAQNQQINHGIYRDLPLAYTDALGKRYLVDFKLLDVKRDGQTENYITKRAGNGIRIYLGNENTILQPGSYKYQITYEMGKVLGFFQDHDELYWNVTGQAWIFPIKQASATIKLPEKFSSQEISTKYFTGTFGSTLSNAESKISIPNQTIEISTTKPLEPYEGLTIAVSWPKGFVNPPNQLENILGAIKANLDLVFGIIGLLLVFGYFYFFWNKKGRDPKKGTVIPLYEPPQNLSPAMLRYVYKMGADDKTLTASIIHLAVLGHIKITEESGLFGSKKYSLNQQTPRASSKPALQEQILLDGFFKTGETYALEKGNSRNTYEIKNDFIESLKKEHSNQYFILNSGVFAFGLILSFVVLGLVIYTTQAITYRPSSSLFLLFIPTLAILLLTLNIVFYKLLKAYTPMGRKLVDEILGFKDFLSVTEKDRLNFHNPPEKTPELFEKMLPYALALGVENKWSEQFAGVFASLKEKGINYAPLWFYGSGYNFMAQDFGSKIGNSFSGAVSSASTPPGSSSGSGGSSGGGGGGGGGGGW